MPQFHETKMGVRFFTGQIPGLISKISELTLAIHGLTNVLKPIAGMQEDAEKTADALSTLAEAFQVLNGVDPAGERIKKVMGKVDELLDEVKLLRESPDAEVQTPDDIQA